ncbi:hypothetical protein GTY58_39230 [Streptomyces sp. SID5469]|nr:hypothetical protein [Streptomyces sp. SID5469]
MQGKIGRVIRDPRDDAELLALVRRYVTPERRYLKLGGGLLRMQSRGRATVRGRRRGSRPVRACASGHGRCPRRR